MAISWALRDHVPRNKWIEKSGRSRYPQGGPASRHIACASGDRLFGHALALGGRNNRAGCHFPQDSHDPLVAVSILLHIDLPFRRENLTSFLAYCHGGTPLPPYEVLSFDVA